MKSKEVIKVRTNAELLNELLGTDYTSWMKSYYDTEKNRIWMIRLDNQTRNNWRNYESGDTIVEENLDRRDTSGVRTDIRPDAERIVFAKENGFFVFKGIYKYDKERSRCDGVRYWLKVSDEF